MQRGGRNRCRCHDLYHVRRSPVIPSASSILLQDLRSPLRTLWNTPEAASLPALASSPGPEHTEKRSRAPSQPPPQVHICAMRRLGDRSDGTLLQQLPRVQRPWSPLVHRVDVGGHNVCNFASNAYADPSFRYDTLMAVQPCHVLVTGRSSRASDWCSGQTASSDHHPGTGDSTPSFGVFQDCTRNPAHR